MARVWWLYLLATLGLVSHGHIAGAQGVPTMVLLHGMVWTEDPSHPQAQAVAVQGNRIMAVGQDAEITKLAGPKTLVIDAKGRRVLPGFNDAHVHFLAAGISLASVQLRDAKREDAFRKRIASFAKTMPVGTWMTGGNWDHESWPGAKLPTHQLIDDVTPHTPVALWRLDGHMLLANARAMQLAGVSASTPDVPGGVIVRDAQRHPTGIFKDAAMALIVDKMPLPNEAQMQQALVAACHYAAERGVTSVQTMSGMEDLPPAKVLHAYEEAARSGALTVRVTIYPILTSWQQAAERMRPGRRSDLVHLNGVKGFADGSLGSRTAWMLEPYDDDASTSGIASAELASPTTMYADMKNADAAGLQIAVHAIGDRANHTVLDMYERLEKENPVRDRRLRIEHAQNLTPQDLLRFAPLHVIASMQPYHAIDAGRWAEKRLGVERLPHAHPWRSLLDSGAMLVFGSDWPVAPMDPLMGIYAAATRRTLDGKNPNGWVPEQRITVREAIHAYTQASAFAEYREHEKGSIEPGKLADMVIVTDDILQEDPAKLENARVAVTVFDGKVIYQR